MAKAVQKLKSFDIVRVKPSRSKYRYVRKAVRRLRRIHPILFAIILVVIVAGISIGSILIFKNNNNDSLSGAAELRVVEAEVSKHYLLPTNEVPALATVTDESKLTSPFFKDAKDGDKVLIYEKNQLAIIYRPSIDRIVMVGPVDLESTGSTSTGN
ncbi:MAG TPA: hypothetical protein VMR18_00400 [Candidatus Saccharimonadales bacterium]|jgi:hypothetical protein|nr:hypothetical protein [Candidatus Saccharimonadales bacterium]